MNIDGLTVPPNAETVQRISTADLVALHQIFEARVVSAWLESDLNGTPDLRRDKDSDRYKDKDLQARWSGFRDGIICAMALTDTQLAFADDVVHTQIARVQRMNDNGKYENAVRVALKLLTQLQLHSDAHPLGAIGALSRYVKACGPDMPTTRAARGELHVSIAAMAH